MEYLWVYLTLAEAYQGLGRTSDEERLGSKIESEATEFGKGSHLDQKAKLKATMDKFERRMRPGELSAEAVAVTSTEPLTTNQQFRPAVSSDHNPSMI